MKRLALILILSMATLLTGCASVPMASTDQDVQAKSFATKSDKSKVYVYRNETFGAAIKLHLSVDGKPVADTAANTYVAMVLAPGKHTLSSGGESDSVLNVSTEAGKNYFVWQEVKMGILSARSQLHLVDDKTGKAGVAECRLIDTAVSAPTTDSHAGVSLVTGADRDTRDAANDDKKKVVIQKVAFRTGVSSATVEHLARRFACTGGAGAGLITKQGPVEIYRMQCDNGTTFMAECELRQCRPMR